jgi:hypothetical protein
MDVSLRLHIPQGRQLGAQALDVLGGLRLECAEIATPFGDLAASRIETQLPR